MQTSRPTHVGYLYSHGHALQLARRAYEQACLKVNPATVAAFFAEVLNNGGSTHYGLGAAVEEARQWGVALLPPCVQRSTDRYVVEDVSELESRPATGAVRVPLTAIRGLSPRAARHILIARKAFGGFGSLLDFCRKVDRGVVTRQDLLLLVKLGAFAWTGLSRGQLAFAEQYYTGAAELLRAADRDPSGAASIEADFAEGTARSLDVEDWPLEVAAAFELSHLGFYCVAPHEVQRHAKRLAEEFGTVAIAELVDYPDKAPVSLAGIVTTLVRTTKKGEPMAWIVISDGTAAVECAVFPKAFEKLNGPTVLREGAFLVGRGRLAREEATGLRCFIDDIVPLGGRGAHLSAIAVAVEQRPDDVPPPTSLIA
ncbi:MAG: hypothetical protein JOZ81_08025 [Chloroflexi bacterium]|nr:hypothetical protein [Chloroflexota bacterium]